jgi:hypothetical protein
MDQNGRSFGEHIGSLILPASISRPDIAVGAYTSNPSTVHWTAMKRIFRYLKGTRQWHGIAFGGLDSDVDPNSIFNHYGAYSDPDFTSNPDDSRSVSGYF